MYKIIKDGNRFNLWELTDNDELMEVLAVFNTYKEAEFWEELLYNAFTKGIEHVVENPEEYLIK